MQFGRFICHWIASRSSPKRLAAPGSCDGLSGQPGRPSWAPQQSLDSPGRALPDSGELLGRTWAVGAALGKPSRPPLEALPGSGEFLGRSWVGRPSGAPWQAWGVPCAAGGPEGLESWVFFDILLIFLPPDGVSVGAAMRPRRGCGYLVFWPILATTADFTCCF